MKRINHKNINTPDLSAGHWKHRWQGELNYVDFDRFKQLMKYYEGGTYADVGCFNSPMPVEAKKAYPDAKIYGIDHSKEVIHDLQDKYPEVDWMVADCYKLPFPNGTLDYIVAGEIIEHLEDPKAFVNEMYRCLKTGGWLAISTPWEETISQSCFGGEEHIWAFEQGDMERLMKRFKKVEVNINKDNYNIIMAYAQK